MKNPIIRYGVYGGILGVVLGYLNWFLTKGFISYSQSEIIGYLSFVMALSSVYFAIRKYRDEFNSGIISFGKAMKIGLLTTLIPCVFTFFQTVIFFYAFGEDFKEWSFTEMKRTMTPEEYESFLQQYESMSPMMENPFFQGAIMFITVFLIGLIISLISATLLKKDAV